MSDSSSWITRAVSSPSVVLVGGIRMSTTTSSGLFSRASETRSVPLRPATLVSGFPAGRHAGSAAGGKPRWALAVTTFAPRNANL